MDGARVLDVLAISLPVFAMMGLGKVLQRAGMLTEDRVTFVNALVYNFALPALIFPEIAKQNFFDLLQPAIFVPPLVATAVTVGGMMLLARFLADRGVLAAAFVAAAFWANTGYVGFPICTAAFGEDAMAEAGIYNAFLVPPFILTAYLLYGVYGGGAGQERWRTRVRRAIVNPVVMSALLGIAVSLLASPYRGAHGALAGPEWVSAIVRIGAAFIELVGKMGLPLALLAIGASLRAGEVRTHWKAVGVSSLVKVVFFPLVTYGLLLWWFPEAGVQVRGVTVIEAATPTAVTCYVVSRRMGVEEGFVSSILVVSTVASVVTIPAWLYVLLPAG